MNDAPLFSIVTVCLNAEAHLAEAIESVLAQTWSDYEYVVSDGGSTDGTLDILRAFEPQFGGRMKWASTPDSGIYDAMNHSLIRTSGDYVEFLGADDRLRPDALAAVSRAVRKQEPPAIVCGATHVFGPSGAWDDVPRRVIRRGLVARVPASHQAVFVRRELIDDAGGFDLRYSIAADYDLYLRLVEAGCTETFVDDVLVDFQLGGLSSRNAWETARDYRDVRIAHGANSLVENMVMLKSAAATTAHATWMRVFGRAPRVPSSGEGQR